MFLLIDARNAFNKENRTAMLLSVWHEWTGGAQFTFNCYRHWATLVVRDTVDLSGRFLYNKEGVTQREPLNMIAYGRGFLPLIRDLRRAHPRVKKPWYAGDTGTGGKFEEIMDNLRDLQLRGPAWGYYPDPTKSISVVAERNVPRAKKYFKGMVLKVVTGIRYLGEFVGER